jgi:5-hydroxyisourate hydrolase
MSITTHVLDTAKGKPASGIPVTLELREQAGWTRVGAGTTDADGRLRTLQPHGALRAGTYRLRFDTGGYLGKKAFFPEVCIIFEVHEPEGHYHVPLLLSPFGYSTYRGT